MTSETNAKEVKVSVVVPVYKVERYLQDCIDSLLAQTFGSIEFIFVDDASPDSCGEILERNAAEHPDLIRVIHLPENRHLGGARNAGIAAAKGEYIGFVDSDDMVLPDMYELLYNSVTESGSDACFITASRIPHDKTWSEALSEYRRGAELPVHIPVNGEKARYNGIGETSRADKEFLYVTLFTGGVWAGLWKKKTITDNGVSFPEHMCYEDYYWNSLIIPYLSKIRYVDSVQYLYRINPKGITQWRSLDSKRDRVRSLAMSVEELKKRGLFETYKAGIEYRCVPILRGTYDVTTRSCKGFFRVRAFLERAADDYRSEFPEWKNNPYYKEQTDGATREKDEKMIDFDRRYYFKTYLKRHLPGRKLLIAAYNRLKK